MSDSIFQFDCPCCGKRIEFDVRSHRARAAKVKDSKANKDFDTLVADQKTEGKRLESAFGQAIDAQRKQQQALENLFDNAKKKVREDGDDEPLRRPFDLD